MASSWLVRGKMRMPASLASIEGRAIAVARPSFFSQQFFCLGHPTLLFLIGALALLPKPSRYFCGIRVSASPIWQAEHRYFDLAAGTCSPKGVRAAESKSAPESLSTKDRPQGAKHSVLHFKHPFLFRLLYSHRGLVHFGCPVPA